MNESRSALLLVGVGGQGVLTAAQILGNAARAAGFPARVGQLHGMSQRGGSIECTVLFGPGHSTFIGDGEADAVIAFEPLEGLRTAHRMHEKTRVLLNTDPIVPFELVRTGRAYPSLERIVGALSGQARQIHTVSGGELVAQTGSDRTLNIVLLGAAAALGFFPFDQGALEAAVVERCAQRFGEFNVRALALGRSAVSEPRAGGQEGQA